MKISRALPTLCCLLLLAAALVVCQDASATGHGQVVECLDISKVWSGHPVGFCLLTSGEYQYVGYYDADRRMTVASRRLDSDKWQYQKLDSRVGWDSHNSIKMAVDSKGYVHLAGNMHCAPLIYFRTGRPYDGTSFKRIDAMTGEKENRCTYPVFIRGADGEFIFRYRDGGSGNGIEIYNVYDPETQTWRRLLDKPLTDGRGRMNAYPIGPVKGSDGWFHLTWVWRDTPDCATNHDLSYARSKDLVHWQRADGVAIDLPITTDTEGVVIDPIPVKGGLINGTGSIGFDSKGRVIIAYHKFDADGNTQAYAARWENESWKTYLISDWKWRWYFSGGGSINFGIRLGSVKPESGGTVSLSYRHKEYGSGIWRLDEKTLKPVGMISRKSDRPGRLSKVESDFAGMQVRWGSDSGASDGKGVKYVLRWETLGRNRDRARKGPLPRPSMLRLYKLTTAP
ncbi:MAG: BNR repeat-containing protein [Planctomycetes bacterium]|nr:BNR repeat-containing protein [Planctomycetota bacterium]